MLGFTLTQPDVVLNGSPTGYPFGHMHIGNPSPSEQIAFGPHDKAAQLGSSER